MNKLKETLFQKHLYFIIKIFTVHIKTSGIYFSQTNLVKQNGSKLKNKKTMKLKVFFTVDTPMNRWYCESVSNSISVLVYDL